jgi:hypothetical protein
MTQNYWIITFNFNYESSILNHESFILNLESLIFNLQSVILTFEYQPVTIAAPYAAESNIIDARS